MRGSGSVGPDNDRDWRTSIKTLTSKLPIGQPGDLNSLPLDPHLVDPVHRLYSLARVGDGPVDCRGENLALTSNLRTFEGLTKVWIRLAVGDIPRASFDGPLGASILLEGGAAQETGSA